jgi:hypothetical protein
MEDQVILTEKGNAAVAGWGGTGVRYLSPSPANTGEVDDHEKGSLLPLLADLLEDGFGEHPFYHCLVAEVPKEHWTPEGNPPPCPEARESECCSVKRSVLLCRPPDYTGRSYLLRSLPEIIASQCSN